MEAERPKQVCTRCSGRFFDGYTMITYVTRSEGDGVLGREKRWAQSSKSI